jgi:hypothetical protein
LTSKHCWCSTTLCRLTGTAFGQEPHYRPFDVVKTGHFVNRLP